MIAGLDSATPPTLGEAEAAASGGVRLWAGYIASRPRVGLLRVWSQAEFAVVQGVFGGRPLAFCSGWDDPAALKTLADSWGLRLCLDVEDGIRGDGGWVDAFLATSGAGLYGNLAAHYHTAPFHIVADYVGFDPQATWPSKGGPGPGIATGWQWQGTHDEFGASVDRGWYDDWFTSGALAPTSTDFYTSGGDDTMVALSTSAGRLDLIYVGTDNHVYHRWQNNKINDLAVQSESWGGGVTKVTACYTDGGQTIAVFAAITTGEVWFKEIAISDGHIVNDWAALGGNAVVLVSAGATGPAGPPGPPGVTPPHTHNVTGQAQ